MVSTQITDLIFPEIFLMTWQEELFQVVGLFSDPTVHQSSGKCPRVGDVVRVVDQDGDTAFVVSNDDKYSAYFKKTTQLRPMDQIGLICRIGDKK